MDSGSPNSTPPADGEIVCACYNLRRQDLQSMLAADPAMSFEELMNKTGAGKLCTACMLDLEYHFVALPRTGQTGRIWSRVDPVQAPTFRRRVWCLLDRLSPLVPMPLAEYMPVVSGDGIEQWVWVANHSLLYGGKECPPDFEVDITVRDSEGQVRYQATHEVAQGAALHLNVSQFLSLQEPQPDRPRPEIGSVAIRRRARQVGFRGTIRPQIEIIAPAGSCAVHTQAPSERPDHQWFTSLYRPQDERLFLSIVNASRSPLDVEFAYPFEASWGDAAPVVETVRVPPHGARLHEIVLPESLASRFLNRLFSIRWRASGARKVHVLCATPTLDCFSIDHV